MTAAIRSRFRAWDEAHAHGVLVVSYVLVSVIWGSTYLAIRVALEGFPPFLLAGVRFLVAGGALYAWLRATGTPAPTRAEWKAASGVGVLLFVVGNGMVVLGQRWLSSSIAAVVVATMPLWAAVFSALGGQRFRRWEWVGLGVGFSGIALLHAGGDLTKAGIGGLLPLLGPVGFAAGSLWATRAKMPTGPMGVASPMVIAGGVLMVLSVISGEAIPDEVTLGPVLALGYLVVAGSLVAFSAYTYLLRHARPAVATSYAYVCPIVAFALGAGFAGEEISLVSIASSAIIIAGVAMVLRGRHADLPRPQPSETT
jgi:drug/metabolite transporter (DMT)-like permease